MEGSLRKLQQDLLSEWGKLEEQVIKLDLWIAENGHVVTEASSFQTRQLFKRTKFDEQEIQSKMLEVVDGLQLHKERLLVQIRKFSEIGIKFKEFNNFQDHDNFSEPICPEVKIEEDGEEDRDILDPLQNPLDDPLAEFTTEEFGNELIVPDYNNETDNSQNLNQEPIPTTITPSRPIKRSTPVQCPICSKTIKLACMLDYHIKTSHDPNWKSKPSTKTPPKPILISTVPGERPFVCGKGCMASFITAGHRSRHEQSCNGEPIDRRGRKQVYVDPSTLDESVREKDVSDEQQEPERRFVCRKNCRARFIRSSHRNRHELGCTGKFKGRRGRHPVFS